MDKLIQLCYASKRTETENTLVDDIREILIKSRRFNSESGVCGVLYYAKGYYFQCLQGESNSIWALFNTIKKDIRHSEVKILQEKKIDKLTFTKWSMKYVQEDTSLNYFFIDNNLGYFKPLDVHDSLIDEFLKTALTLPDKPVFSKSRSGFKNRGYSNFF